MNNISQFSSCANCGACYNVCPKDAIRFKKDSIFYELSVDEDKCISCGKCVEVCPLNTFSPHLDLRVAYGGWSNDSEIVRRSSSGGGFTAIAGCVLKKNGVVYGAVFSDDYKEVIFKSTKEVTLDEIRRSKYVESQPMYVFRDIKNDLDAEKIVLFCGAPCQVAGLKRFLGKEYENLVTCDFACGGMASHKMFEDYLLQLEEKYHSTVKNVNFRPKLYGWSLHAIQIDFHNGKSYRNVGEFDPYMYSFIYGRTSIRENCFDCRFRDNHYSDVIIADFWKWNTISNLSNNEKGISLIIANSQRGEEIINSIRNDMTLQEIDIEEAAYNCSPNQSITKDHAAKIAGFIETYRQAGIEKAAAESGMTHGIEAKVQKLYIAFRRGKFRA